ncbi:S49 family peptidase [Maricaulis sp.]|uniref:S49 family peptidase n=1 Tax=Maricaulis sp. TaxID=1486257 RepID=UPI003A94E811
MSRHHLRPITGPQRLAMAAGHEGAMTYALMDGAAAHIDAPLRPNLGERLGELGRQAGGLLRREPQGDHNWAPEIPEWAASGERTGHGFTLVENIAVIDIEGALMARGFEGYWSGCYWPGYRDYVAALEAANADDRVDGVFERYSTPGGFVSGLYEAVGARAALNGAAGGKPIVGHVSELCCSAGMALASQCDQLFAASGAVVGSIGTRVLYFDMEGAMERWGERAHVFKSGRLKDMGAWWRPPTDEESGLIQLEINHLAEQFYQALAAGRGLDLAAIRKHHGWEAQTFTAGDPPPPAELDPMREDVQLIDGVMTEEAAFRTLQALAVRNAPAVALITPGAGTSRAARSRDESAASTETGKQTMKQISAQLAALLAKQDAGTITPAEAKDLAQVQALLASADADPDPEAEDGTEEVTEGETDDDAPADPPADPPVEDDADAEDDAEDDAEARAAAVFNSAEAKGRGVLAARLAGRAAAGKISVEDAIADLKAAPRQSGLDQRLADAAERKGAKPSAPDKGANANPLLADAVGRNPKLRDRLNAG